MRGRRIMIVLVIALFVITSCAHFQADSDEQKSAQVRLAGKTLGVLLYKNYSDSEHMQNFIESLYQVGMDENALAIRLTGLMQTLGDEYSPLIGETLTDLSLAMGLDIHVPLENLDAFQIVLLHDFLKSVAGGWNMALAFKSNNPGTEIPNDLAERQAE